jgi:hypothetical protein
LPESKKLDEEEAKHLEERLLEARVLIDKTIDELKAGKTTVDVVTPTTVEEAYTGWTAYTYRVGQIVYTVTNGNYNKSPKLLSEEYRFRINFPTKVTEIEEKYVTKEGGFTLERKVVGQHYVKEE